MAIGAAALVQAISTGQARATPRPEATADKAKAHKVAVEFEAFFVARMLDQMFAGVRTDGPFGGGNAEKVYRSMMVDEFGKKVAGNGGFGIAQAVERSLLKAQEDLSR